MTRPVVLLCLLIFGNTFAVGAFPVLLPDIGRAVAIDDFALGALAGAFGFARLVSDIPAGLLITHHLRRALVLGAGAVTAGVLCLAVGGPYELLVAGRLLSGLGHTLVMLSGITGIVRHARRASHGLALNAYEMSGMLGILGGMVCAGFLPRDWPWNVTILVASLPQLVGLALLPALLRALPVDASSASGAPLFSRGLPGDDGTGSTRAVSRLTVLAFVAGALLAVAWSSIGQFILPLRASREFGLDRDGVAMLLAIPQLVDVLVLLPLGTLADRSSRARVLAAVLVVLAAGVGAVAFGSLPLVVIGCVLFGVGLASWMLPVALLNRDGSSHRVAWRTALYRVGVDAGVFLGPVVSGLLAQHAVLWIVGVATSGALVVVSAALLRASGPR
ncbi:MAG TPA: MFS transporter [Burkholderiaceae bacterium]|nr:MFS transporter [Burkholderiaceae bacterium]